MRSVSSVMVVSFMETLYSDAKAYVGMLHMDNSITTVNNILINLLCIVFCKEIHTPFPLHLC